MAAPESLSVPPLPTGEVEQRLIAARTAAVDLLRKAEDLEAEVRDTRRRARSRLRHYEALLSEYQGQMSVLDEEGVL